MAKPSYSSYIQVIISLNIQEDSCKTKKKSDCTDSGNITDRLVSIVKYSGGISNPEDVSLVYDIINNLADKIGVVKTKNETDKV